MTLTPTVFHIPPTRGARWAGREATTQQAPTPGLAATAATTSGGVGEPRQRGPSLLDAFNRASGETD